MRHTHRGLLTRVLLDVSKESMADAPNPCNSLASDSGLLRMAPDPTVNR